MTATTITAGAYLRKRREAVGLSIAEVAAGYAVGSDRDAFAARLDKIERDQDAAGPATLNRMVEIFRFDRDVYRNLIAGLPAGPTLCRVCACSWNDPCVGRGPNCHWAEADRCSRCAGATTEPSLTLPASDPHAIAILSVLSFLRLGQWDKARRELDNAIREDQARARVRPVIDEKGGQYAAALALDMTHFRDLTDALSPVGFFHV